MIWSNILDDQNKYNLGDKILWAKRRQAVSLSGEGRAWGCRPHGGPEGQLAGRGGFTQEESLAGREAPGGGGGDQATLQGVQARERRAQRWVTLVAVSRWAVPDSSNAAPHRAVADVDVTERRFP